jgi:hypothetical protein
MRKILAMTLLLAFATNACAEWKSIGKASNGVYYSYDTAKVIKTAKSVKVRTRLEKAGVQSKPTQMEIQCAKSKYRLLNPTDEWSTIEPGSMIEMLKTELCAPR